MASLTGFEPATRCLEGRRQNIGVFSSFYAQSSPHIRTKIVEAVGIVDPYPNQHSLHIHYTLLPPKDKQFLYIVISIVLCSIQYL